jgi:glucokinase
MIHAGSSMPALHVQTRFRRICLAGDVGGTKTILALFEAEENDVKCLKKEQFSSNNYQTFTELLTSFLTDTESLKITAVCIGASGVIANGSCETTNLPWVLSSKEIGEQINTQNVWCRTESRRTTAARQHCRDCRRNRLG